MNILSRVSVLARSMFWVAALLSLTALACVGSNSGTSTDDAAVATITATYKGLLDSSTELLNEDFSGSEATVDTSETEYSKITIADGRYNIDYSSAGYRSAYYTSVVSNFIAEVDCQNLAGGDKAFCGISFAIADDPQSNDEYFFYVSGAQYGFYTSKGGVVTNVHFDNSAVKEGEVNTLKVINNAGKAELFVNGSLVDTKTTTDLAAGGVGFETSSESEDGVAVKITVDNFHLWQLP